MGTGIETQEDQPPDHPGAAEVRKLRQIWAIFIVSYVLTWLGLDSLRWIRLENHGLMTLESGLIQNFWINALLMSAIFFGIVWWLFGQLEQGRGWVRVVFLAVASYVILSAVVQFVGLAQVPSTLPPILPEPSAEAESFYQSNRHLVELAFNTQAFGRSFAIFRQAFFALAHACLAGWFWRVLLRPSVIQLLETRKAERQALKEAGA